MKHLGLTGGSQEISTVTELLANSDQEIVSSRQVVNATGTALTFLLRMLDSTGGGPHPYVGVYLDPGAVEASLHASDGTITSNLYVTPTGVNFDLPAGASVNLGGDPGTEGQFFSSRGPGQPNQYVSQTFDFGTAAAPASS